MLPFTMVDVFGTAATRGNALAVVHDADGLDDAQMAHLARWTNLSETTFLLTPTTPEADYRVRIWTTSGELPFAGHPTLGSAHAWLAAGGVPRRAGVVVQECGAGLVEVAMGERLAFGAPPLLRSGPVSPAERGAVLAALQVDAERVVDLAWVDNGPGWVGVLLADAQDVLALHPDPARAAALQVAVAGPYPDGSSADVEVRAFYGDGTAMFEDPVTGSANAGLAQWLVSHGHLPPAYVAAQGRCVGADGRVDVEVRDGQVWVGGAVRTIVTGQVDLSA